MLVASGTAGAILVHRLDGDAWRPLPPAAVPPQAKHPRIAAGPSGFPVVAYYDAQTSAIGLARWSGQRWDTRAFAFANDAIDQTPQIVVDHNGTAWIGWRDAASRFNVWMSNY
jgi:hypothetical protein